MRNRLNAGEIVSAKSKEEQRTRIVPLKESGAGKESRTPDLNLGKVALYQLSYSRIEGA